MIYGAIPIRVISLGSCPASALNIALWASQPIPLPNPIEIKPSQARLKAYSCRIVARVAPSFSSPQPDRCAVHQTDARDQYRCRRKHDTETACQ